MKKRVLFLLAVLWPLFAAAQQIAPDIPLMDSQQEQRARALFYELRCEVCQGQTIADSNAALAADMRALVRHKIAEGQSPEDIRNYFSARYGESILMRPPLLAHTLPLWLLPVSFLIIGAICCLRYLLRRKTAL